jgi:nucleoside-diphosphate-sugar epimerase
MTAKNVFITGGTGYIGRVLITRLLERGHNVRALVRRGSELKLPAGCEAVIGNALDASTFADQVQPSDTFVQLVGVPHPSPAKAAEFQSIDLASVHASVSAATGAGVKHFV